MHQLGRLSSQDAHFHESVANDNVVHEGLPGVVPPADNELGWRTSLAKLAALLEAGNAR